MRVDYHRLYMLYPLRSGSALRRIRDLGMEIVTATSAIRGYSQILVMQFTTSDSTMHTVLSERHTMKIHAISSLAIQLRAIPEQLKMIGSEEAEYRIQSVRGEILPIVEEILGLVEELGAAISININLSIISNRMASKSCKRWNTS